MDIKNINKMWNNSLSFLDNSLIKSIIIIVLVLYSSTIFDNINSFVGNIYNFSIIRLVILLVIVYVSPKCPTIGILLAVSYLISLNYMVNNENFGGFPGFQNTESFAGCPGFQNTESFAGCPGFQNTESFAGCPGFQNNESFTGCPGFQNNESFTGCPDFQSTKSSVPIKESFFPLVNENDKQNSFDMRLNNTNMNTRSKGGEEKNTSLNVPDSCMQNYVPRFESVSDVCSPTATFKNELNAQGLNFPGGFDQTVNGSPL
jgi:hypothetical protein